MSTHSKRKVGRSLRTNLLKPAFLVLQGFAIGAALSVTFHPFAEPLPAAPESTDAMLLSAQA